MKWNDDNAMVLGWWWVSPALGASNDAPGIVDTNRRSALYASKEALLSALPDLLDDGNDGVPLPMFVVTAVHGPMLTGAKMTSLLDKGPVMRIARQVMFDLKDGRVVRARAAS